MSLGKPSLRLRLEAYYSLIAPETIADEASWRKRFEQIYDKFDLRYDDEMEVAVRSEMQAKSKPPSHRYDLEQFGLSRERLDDLFAEYRESFDVAVERSA